MPSSLDLRRGSVHALISLLILSVMFVPAIASSEEKAETIPLERIADIEPDTKAMDSWTHRPVEELFTSLSCPPCMSNSEPEINAYHAQYRDDPSVPFTWIAFHQTNGGDGDDVFATQEAKDRYSFYSVLGTPTGEFDGGYVESQDHSGAMDEAGSRSVAPTNLHVFQQYDGEKWRFEVNLTYLGESYSPDPTDPMGSIQDLIDGDVLDFSLYLFVIEDDVLAYSSYEEEIVVSHNVHRATVIDDDVGMINAGESYNIVAEWEIPETVTYPDGHASPGQNPIHPVNPAKISVVAVVYDNNDESKSSSPNAKQGVPRAINSATPASTAYDLENSIPRVTERVENVYSDSVELIAFFNDDDGISSSYMVWNDVESNFSGVWNIEMMDIEGEEICDENGVCYAYGNAAASTILPYQQGSSIYYQLMYTDGAQITGMSEVQLFQGTSLDDKESSSWLFWLLGSGVLIVLASFGVFTYWARQPYEGTW